MASLMSKSAMLILLGAAIAQPPQRRTLPEKTRGGGTGPLRSALSRAAPRGWRMKNSLLAPHRASERSASAWMPERKRVIERR